MNRHERRQAVAAGRKRVIRRPSATPPSPTMSVGSRSEPVTGGLAASAIAAKTFPARILYPVCPLCGSGDLALVQEADCTAHPLYKPPLPNAMRWKSCTACEHVFTEGFFTAEALDVVFGDTHKNQQVGSDFERRRPVSARMIRQVTPYVTSGDWLDVGFGNGSLVFTADEFGFNAVGVDLRSTNVEGLRRLGFEAYCSDVADLDMTGRFSVISMADVLEHIPYPNKALAAAYRLLRPGGVTSCRCPMQEPLLGELWMRSKQTHSGLSLNTTITFRARGSMRCSKVTHLPRPPTA